MSDDLDSIADTFAAALQVPSPCDRCPHVARCEKGEACEQFAGFARLEGEKRWRGKARQPSAAIYQRMFGDEIRRAA